MVALTRTDTLCLQTQVLEQTQGAAPKDCYMKTFFIVAFIPK